LVIVSANRTEDHEYDQEEPSNTWKHQKQKPINTDIHLENLAKHESIQIPINT
jgi:hypothetical protein